MPAKGRPKKQSQPIAVQILGDQTPDDLESIKAKIKGSFPSRDDEDAKALAFAEDFLGGREPEEVDRILATIEAAFPREAPITLIGISDKLSFVVDVIVAAWMAAGTLERRDADPMQAILDSAEKKLKGAIDDLERYRHQPAGERPS
jgi:hypothetical protein